MSVSKPSVLIIGARDEESIIRKQLDGLADVTGSEPTAAGGMALLSSTSPTCVLLYLDHGPEEILKLARSASKSSAAAVIIVSRERNPDNILVAMRNGARDYAYLEEDGTDVRRAVTELVTARESTRPTGGGEVITVFSAKGGSGATTVATNLAGTLARQEGPSGPLKVVVLDFDLEMGDVLVFLDMAAPFSYQELLANMHRLDSELIYSTLARHGSDVFVVSQTDYLEEGRETSPEDLTSTVNYLTQYFDYVVIDGLRDFRPHALAALDRADHVLLTMTQDIPALKNANRCLRLFKRLGYESDKVKLALNRYRRSTALNPDAIADALGRPVSATIANDFPTVIKCVNEGRLIVNAASGTRVAKDVGALASVFHGGAPVERKGGLFSLWGKG